MKIIHEPSRANKADAGKGSYGICRVINAFASAPDAALWVTFGKL
jgi:hypothetical protein